MLELGTDNNDTRTKMMVESEQVAIAHQDGHAYTGFILPCISHPVFCFFNT